MRFFSFFGNSTISKITLGSASRALWAAEPRGLNDNSSQFYLSIIVNFFPFCGLEECAMHIDNPQMRELFFCGVTRQIMPRVRPTAIAKITMQRSCFFRLKVRGERLKAGSFYRFAINHFML